MFPLSFDIAKVFWPGKPQRAGEFAILQGPDKLQRAGKLAIAFGRSSQGAGELTIGRLCRSS